MNRQDLKDKPLYNSRIIDNFIKLIKKRYSYVKIDELLDYAKMENYQIDDQGHWFTQEQVNLFHKKLIKLTGNKDIAREAGRYAASPDALGVMRAYFLGLVGPGRVFKIVRKAAANLTKSSVYESKKIDSNSVEITVKPREGVREELFQCENRKGFFEAIAMMFNHRLPEISHPECIFRGNDACRYIVSWKASNASIWKNISNAIVLIFFIILIVSCFLAPFFTITTLLPVLLSVALSVKWYTSIIEKRELNEAINNLWGSSDRLMEQINKNYNDAMTMNEVGQALNKQVDIDNIMVNVIQVLEKRLDYDRALILLTNENKNELVFRTGFGYSDEQLRILNNTDFALDKPKSKGAFVVSFKEQRSILVRNIRDIEDSLSAKSRLFAKQMGVSSFICCPIIYEEESLGILAVDKIKNHDPLTQSDMHLLMGITPGIGISIHNALLLEAEVQQFKSVIRGLAATIDARDPLTAGHSEKVTEYCVGICRELGLSEDTVERIQIAALLHDYGKIGIEDSILKKDGALTTEEYTIIKTHADKSKDILERMNFKGVYRDIPEIAWSHHEKVDGSGYPRGLKGHEILTEAKIIAVADFFEAITSKRHYRDPMPVERALDLLRDNIEKSFDRGIVEAFIRYYCNRAVVEKYEEGNIEKEASGKCDEDKQRKFERIETDIECRVELIGKHSGKSESIKAIALDYSEGGMGLSCEGDEIPAGANIQVYVEEVKIIGKIAIAVWSTTLRKGRFRTGLQWV